MTSVTTNAFALGALTILRGVNTDLTKVQEQVSSGYKIETAADDPSYWSMATTMRSDGSSLTTISNALGLGSAKVDTAYSSMDSAIDVITQIRNKLVSATEAGVDRTALNTDISALKDQLESISQSANVSGDNWLYNTNVVTDTNKSVISDFVRGTLGQVYVESVNYDASQSVLIDTVDPSRGLLTKSIDANTIDPEDGSGARDYYLLSAGTGAAASGSEISLSSDTTSDEIADMIAVTNSILSSMTSAAANMGTMQARIDQQSTFVSNLSDSIKDSVGDLVDTDMDEASSRVTALQTAQQMAVQSLSIANTMSSKILILLQK